MAYFEHFDEAFYRASYSDVRTAINTPRSFVSGFEHFSLYGLNERRTQVSPFFNEGAYLALYPDVANAVRSGVYRSGVEHFALRGADEGRYSPIITNDSEQIYLQRNPDVVAAVRAGAFRSGYDHFLRKGQFEGRVPGSFNEQSYLLRNPDVARVIGVADPTTGVVEFNSGYEHYIRFGQFENRTLFFSGTSGNDVVTSFGGSGNTSLVTGVNYVPLSVNPIDYTFRSTGVGEIDTLTGGSERNQFTLGFGRSPSNPNPVQLYVGGGNADYALIRNFTRGFDTIQLTGSINDYNQQVSGNNLTISTRNGNDLVAIVEGITSPLSLAGANAVNTTTGVFVIN
ncbi:hypothetical protein ACE1CI_11655 [Aerosakkonemataceae cyanobacterium BLCC-F50]|uniref:Calcium-binding protein n=1 Tax=Floridaenema flaviceps BLCC-F50 TaxID=3153642 RepID=A0ABV4XPD1_9CYAN